MAASLIADDDYPIRVKITKSKGRSLSQNALYWMWLGEISKQAKVNGGVFDPEIWHEYLKKYFCPEKTIFMPAGANIAVKSTAKLDKPEMHHYLNKVEQWAQGHKISLTIPIDCEYAQLLEAQNV